MTPKPSLWAVILKKELMALRNLIGEVLDGKYRVEKLLGEGGMGAVYLATHLGTERPVAVKVIAPQFMQHDEFVERFRREARAAGRLRHPNVVDVTDFGFALVGKDEMAYLVMEFLDGFTLDVILAEESVLPLGWVIDIIDQICSAVDEAHQQGIIHRDLKPENIWLEPNRRGGYTVKVLDFGIAKLDEKEVESSKEANELLASSLMATTTPSRGSDFPTLLDADTPSSVSTSGNELRATTRMMPGRNSGADLSEAGTLIAAPEVMKAEDSGTDLFPHADSEASTLLVPNGEGVSEAGTCLLPPTALEAGTRILQDVITDKNLASDTATGSSLTRVGAILGTPLYMSPEQCRGETLDTRSDIYSLGVIAYRLFSGKTPFSGPPAAVLRMHAEEQPPQLEVKRVPRKVSALVMRALAKTPAERPTSAAAFASALRAHSTGVGTLLRQALTLYSEHLPTFLRLAVLAYWPVVLLTFLKVAIHYLSTRGIIPRPWGLIADVVANLLTILVMIFSACLVVGVTTWLVTQVLAIPLRPLFLQPAFKAMKKRLRPFVITNMLTTLMCVLGLVVCFVPGLYLLTNFALIGPVLMMEDLRGFAAMRRARELYRRARRTVIAIVLLHLGAPILVSSVSALIIVAVVKLFKPPANQFSTIVDMVQPLVSLPTTIFFSSLASVITALLYWKTRLAGGETMSQALAQFAEAEVGARGNLARIRTRLGTPLKTTR
jgi:serine/threonine protein kinase